MATFPPDLEDDLAILPVDVDKSTTITGFYARLVRHDPQGPNDWIGLMIMVAQKNPVILLNLGVISERV
jgi:hypothetical protein